MNACVAGGRTLSSTCDSLNSLDLASAMLGVRVSGRLGSLLVGTVPLSFQLAPAPSSGAACDGPRRCSTWAKLVRSEETPWPKARPKPAGREPAGGRRRDQRGYVVVVTGVLYGTTRRSLHPVESWTAVHCGPNLALLPTYVYRQPPLPPLSLSFSTPRRSRAADTVHNLYYRHRCPVHGTAYASLFLHPSASVITQLGQSCSAATRLSLQS